MKIKAISIWQPRASLIAVGAKKYETRSWNTSYRGPLLICAAKTDKPAKKAFMDPIFSGVARTYISGYWDLPYGYAVALVEITDCFNTQEYGWTKGLTLDDIAMEKLFGDFSPGRFAWKLENVRQIKPFPVKGRQGLFEVTIKDDILTGGHGRYVIG